MKKNKLVLLGSLLVATIGVLISISVFGIDKKGSYEKSQLSFLQETTVDDAAAWMAARLIDPETGQKVTAEKLRLIEKAIKNMPTDKGLPLAWTEEGPDNIGGRTRAILVDKNNNSRIYAGSVSGGLYVSNNGANLWSRVENFPGVSFISSMAQMSNGAIFVATGMNYDPMSQFSGNGVWYTQDNGSTWTVVPGTSSLAAVHEIACATGVSNKLWLTTSTGLKSWDFGAGSLTNVTTGSGACNALQISKDGSTIVCAIGSNKTYVSNDGGTTFTDRSGNTGAVVPIGAGRIEYAISATKNANNFYTLYAVRTGSNLQGMNISLDGGTTWSQFFGAINPPSNVDIYRGQGTYNTIVSVDPTDTKRIFVGGIDIWRWTQTTNNPPSGGIEPASLWSVSPNSPIYVHADNHEMKWDANNRLYVGNDGGIGVTNDQGNTWYPANRGYNVTQFYGMAFDKNGSVAGGTQDNGTLYNNHTLSTYQEFSEIGGGDGFHCAISYYNPSIIFSTVYNGEIYRSIDGGNLRNSFIPVYPASYGSTGLGGGSVFPFYNFIKLVEYYDTNSEDSLLFAPSQNYAAGATVQVPSAATGNFIQYVTPTALYYDDEVSYTPGLTETRVSVVNAVNGQTVLLGNYNYTPFPSASGTNPPTVGDSLTVNFPTGPALVVVQSVGSYPWYFAQNTNSGKIIELGSDSVVVSVAWDTVSVQDPYQSWFVTYVNANGGEVWGTRDALRLSVVNPKWVPLARNVGGTGADLIDIEFSKDMNRMYVAAGTKVTRVDGLGSIYTSDPNFLTKAGYCCAPTYLAAPTGTSITTVSSGTVEGIALNPSNSNDLIVFAGGGVAKRSLNAGSATPTFTNLSSISGANSPYTYDGIIDRDDDDIIVIGTSHGVFVSDNGGTSWTQSNAGFDGTPVYHVVQSTRTFAEGNTIPGAIFVATHGRGIWKSSSLLGLKDNTKTDVENFKTKLKAFPNPTTDNTSLSFELLNSGSVDVYVYSITGVKVKTVHVKSMASGTNTLDLEVSDLPNGTYIVKFASGGQNQTTKFIKM